MFLREGNLNERESTSAIDRQGIPAFFKLPFPGSKSPGSAKDVMCYEILLGEETECCKFSTELFIKT